MRFAWLVKLGKRRRCTVTVRELSVVLCWLHQVFLTQKTDTKFSKIRSGMFIPDPGSIFFSILDPGSGSRIHPGPPHCTPQGTSTLIGHSNIFRWRGRAVVALASIPNLSESRRILNPGLSISFSIHMCYLDPMAGKCAIYYWFFETFITVPSCLRRS